MQAHHSKHPRISVVMSVHSGGKYLKTAIASVLEQSFTDFEFIIVCDGCASEDHSTFSSFSDNRISIIHNQHNQGLTRSLNRALELSQGDYIARHDADDISLPNRFQQQVDFLDSHREVMLVGSSHYVIDENDKILSIIRRPTTLTSIRWSMLFDNAFAHSSVMFRRQIVSDEFRGYNEAFSRTQDYELWSRIVIKHSVANLSSLLTKIRIHAGNITSTQVKLGKMFSEQVIVQQLNYYDLPVEWASVLAEIRLGYSDQTLDSFRKMEKILPVLLAKCKTKDRYFDRSEVLRSASLTAGKLCEYCASYNPTLALRFWFLAMKIDWRYIASKQCGMNLLRVLSGCLPNGLSRWIKCGLLSLSNRHKRA